MEPQVLSSTSQNSLFHVSAKIGGYVVTKPDPSNDAFPIRDFVCMSKAEVHAHLEQWIVWIERDEKEMDSIEEGMRAKK